MLPSVVSPFTRLLRSNCQGGRSRRPAIAALGLGVADRVLILENAYYSVISPEGCAAILWKDRSASAKAAEALKITARHLLELGLVDEMVPEPLGGAHTNPELAATMLDTALERALAEVSALGAEARLDARYRKWRAMGNVGLAEG